MRKKRKSPHILRFKAFSLGEMEREKVSKCVAFLLPTRKHSRPHTLDGARFAYSLFSPLSHSLYPPPAAEIFRNNVPQIGNFSEQRSSNFLEECFIESAFLLFYISLLYLPKKAAHSSARDLLSGPRHESSNLLTAKKKDSLKTVLFLWRRRRDSNSRAGYPTYTLSRGASSAYLSTSP